MGWRKTRKKPVEMEVEGRYRYVYRHVCAWMSVCKYVCVHRYKYMHIIP